MVVDQRAVIRAALDITEHFVPDEALAPDATLDGGPADGPDISRGSDCRRGGQGWSEYGDLDSVHGNRATGAEACLDSSYVATHPGTSTDTRNGIKPPGSRDYLRYLGGRPSDVNAFHLLGRQLSGSGTNLANLAPCGSDANSYIGKPKTPIPPLDSMLDFENTVRSLVDSQHVVWYDVTSVYKGSRTVPYEFEMAYAAWDSRGRYVGTDATGMPNLVYTAGR
ncbi:DNA/RNA non-specific endonuclease [Streptomyces sp. NPDC055642]